MELSKLKGIAVATVYVVLSNGYVSLDAIMLSMLLRIEINSSITTFGSSWIVIEMSFSSYLINKV